MANLKSPVKDAVLTALKRQPMDAEQLAKRTGGSLQTIRRMMTTFCQDGRAHVVSETRPYVYALGPAPANIVLIAANNRERDALPPRRKAPYFKPFRDEMQALFFGRPEVHHDAR